MTVQLKKVIEGKYEVTLNRGVVGYAFKNYEGMYTLKLPNGIAIKATNQRVLKEMVIKNILTP